MKASKAGQGGTDRHKTQELQQTLTMLKRRLEQLRGMPGTQVALEREMLERRQMELARHIRNLDTAPVRGVDGPEADMSATPAKPDAA